MSEAAGETVPASPPPLGEIATFFLKLGTIAFGGPAAHIAMMEDELVRRRKWISSAEFLDLLAVSNLLPGPSSTELAIFIGYRLRGARGLLLAGVCFILPAFLMVAAIAWAYVRYQRLPAVAGILQGVKPVVIAIVLQALWRLGRSAIKTASLAALAVVALGLSQVIANPLNVMAAIGCAAAMIFAIGNREPRVSAFTPLLPPASLATGAAASMSAKTLTGIFLVFLKLGSIVFGSGYVLLAFLRTDLVTNRHWLTEGQLLDSVAVGQVTPGPVFTTATFIGYILAGPKGAFVATAGIFAPAFILVALTGSLVRQLRRSRIAGAMLDGFNVAALALMASVTWELAKSALLKSGNGAIDWLAVALSILSAVFLLRFKINSTWLILIGAIAGVARILIIKS